MALVPSVVRDCEPILERIENLLPGVREQLAVQCPSMDHDLGLEGWTPTRLVSSLERIVVQVRALLVRPDRLEIPHTAVWDVYGRGSRDVHLVAALNNLHEFLVSQHWSSAAEWTESCVGYLVRVGHWHNPLPVPPPESRLVELASKYEQAIAHAAAQLEKANQLHAESVQTLRTIEQEAGGVREALGRAQSDGQQIGSKLNEASSVAGQITQMSQRYQEVLAAAEVGIRSLNAQLAEAGATLKGATDSLEKSRSVAAWIEEQREIVNELAGTAAAGVLGKKFEARATELETSVNLWRWIMGGAVVFSALWVCGAWKFLRHDQPDFWVTIASNFGLLLPPAALLGFVGLNYSRERHFQEEYAFRSSIAMTISVFAERLSSDPTAQKELITETVRKLYQTPHLLADHPKTNGAISSKDASALIEKLSKLIGEVKR